MNRQRNKRTIWKFTLDPFGTPFIDLPEGADVLSAGVQGDDIVVWVLCDPEKPTLPRYVAGFPTGGTIPPATARFVGTCQMSDGLVFHVFEGEK